MSGRRSGSYRNTKCMFVQWSPLITCFRARFVFLAAVSTATALVMEPTKEACTQSWQSEQHWNHFKLVPLGPPSLLAGIIVCEGWHPSYLSIITI